MANIFNNSGYTKLYTKIYDILSLKCCTFVIIVPIIKNFWHIIGQFCNTIVISSALAVCAGGGFCCFGQID